MHFYKKYFHYLKLNLRVLLFIMFIALVTVSVVVPIGDNKATLVTKLNDSANEYFAGIFDVNAEKASQNIQKAIEEGDYEKANDLYVQVQDAKIGTKKYENLAKVREQIDYYRRYRLAVDLVKSDNSNEYKGNTIISYLANMPPNFGYANDVIKLLLSAKELISLQDNTSKNTNINDSDPIVNCGPGEHSKQYVKDKSSNCKNYVDCGLNNNTVWTMMLNSECIQKHAEETGKYTQNTQQTNSTSKKIPVFLSYWNYTVYCSPENVGAAYSINSTLESNKAKDQQNYQTCVNNFQQTNSCYIACKSNSFQDSKFDYGACIATCPSTADACNWVYSQSNSTRDQINNLCSWVSN